MKTAKQKKVLVSGASMAGLSTAYWMNKMGYQVTVIEMANEPRTAGGAINIEGIAIDAVKRMEIFEDLKSCRLNVERVSFKKEDDATEGSILLRKEGDELPDDDIEIERSAFVHILLDKLKNKVAFIFNNSIIALDEANDNMLVSFKSGGQQSFDLVIGCDGMHSGVRRIWFGEEANYTHFLGGYFSISIVNKLLVPQKTMELYGVPDKSVMLNAYNNKTDIIFCFNTNTEISYDYRNEPEQRKIILEQFTGLGWRTAALLEEVQHADNFYFDKFCQIKMPSWTKGRVALVGDAGYCASPAAGKGGSLSVIGAAALADALEKNNGNFEPAFHAYDKNLRPFIDAVQTRAALNVREIIPRTEQAILKRNKEGFSL